MTETVKKLVVIRVDPEIVAAVDALIGRSSRNAWIVQAIRVRMERERTPTP